MMRERPALSGRVDISQDADLAAPSELTGLTQLAELAELARRARAALSERGWRVTTAESCTGGLLGHVLTEVAGISQQYLGGVITYSDELKRTQLGVSPATLTEHGAVSAETAREMAINARLRLGSDVAVAITGIAGPDGGTPEKPVGLTYVAVADERGHSVRRHVWQRDRSGNKLDSARAALELLVERLARE